MLNIDIGYFRAVQNGVGAKCRKDIKLAEARQRFDEKLDSSFNYEYDITRNGIPQEFIISPSKSIDNECTIFARPNEEVHMGDILYWNKVHWLVTSVNYDDITTLSGKIELCNRTIKWQNPETKEIHERWCIAEKPYTSNIDKGKEVNTSNREFKVRVPYDEETALVDVDKRFLLEEINGQPKAYKVTCVDTITNKFQDVQGGFLIWNLTQSEYNHTTDNAELMIADYDDSTNPVSGSFDISFRGKAEIRAGGSAKTFTAETIKPVVWSIATIPEVEPYVSLSISGNSVKIKADRESIIIGTSIKLTANNGSDTSEVIIKILGGM